MQQTTTTTVESVGSSWKLLDWTPAPEDPLKGLVERIWHTDGFAGSAPYRVLPQGMVEVCVVLRGAHAVVTSRGTRRLSQPVTVVAGTSFQPTSLQAIDPRLTILGVRLHPLFAFRILGFPISALGDSSVEEFDDQTSCFAERLMELTSHSRSRSGLVGRLRAWLTRLAEAPVDRARRGPLALRAARRIAGSGGAVRVKDLEAELGVSRHRLSRAFQRSMGVGPKRYARAHRFRKTLRLLETTDAGLSRVALAAGYYDQAHMTNEVKELSGLTPGEFRASTKRLTRPSPERTLAPSPSGR